MTPSTDDDAADIAFRMARINAAWLEGHPEDMAPYLADAFAMTLPGFTGSLQGRDTLIGSFQEFARSAVLGECQLTAPEITVAGPIGVATFPWVVVYERDGARWRSTGRDVWVFGRVDNEWQAAWRLMLDLAEEPAP